MWKIFQEEFYKIASKKLIWIGLFCLLGFVTYRLAMVVDDYTMTAGQETIHGKEAIAKDQELTAQYAGPLTEEKVQTIYEKYGFFYLNRETGEQNGNYCSHFITEQMTNSKQLEEPTLEEIQFYQGSDEEGMEELIAAYTETVTKANALSAKVARDADGQAVCLCDCFGIGCD